jgi:hypothetical protein
MRSRQAHAPGAPDRRPAALLVAALLGLGLSGCEDTPLAPVFRTLDSPVDMAFTCYGRLRLTQGQAPTDTQPIVTSPMPGEACGGWNAVEIEVDDNDTPMDESDDQEILVVPPPAGQGPIGLDLGSVLSAEDRSALLDEWQAAVALYGFALQQNEGSIALVRQPLGGTANAALVDADPFTPGTNVIPVGVQPVGIATDPTGCHVMTANAGSCDLSVLEVATVLSRTEVPVARSVPVRNAAGEILAARPRAIASQVASAPIGVECADSPDNLVYVAYPDCNAVAVVHAGTGEIRASIVFGDGGSVVLGDGNLSCGAAACGEPTTPPVVESPDAGPAPDAGLPDAGAPDASVPAPDAGVAIAAVGGRPRPTALHMASDGGRLYIGAENSPQVTVVELDAGALPAAVWSVPLAGEVGVTALAATELIPMGGELGRADEGPFGMFRFVYAAATDNTVRVVEVHDRRRECDTQGDARYLHEVRDGQLLACLPVDDPALPEPDDPALPQRVGARAPGIHMPGNARPLDITFARAPGVEVGGGAVRPSISAASLVGYFAFVSLSTGDVAMINVDDDNYGDVESTTVPVQVDMGLALPHQLRDTGNSRRTSRYCCRPQPVDDNADIDCYAGGTDNGPPAGCECAPDDAGGNEPLACYARAESCAFPAGVPEGPPSMTAPSATTMVEAQMFQDYSLALPALRAVECVSRDTETESSSSTAVPELSLMAPDALRELAFPDLQAVRNETWNIAWEAALSRQPNAGVLPPPVRLGFLAFEDSGVALRDGGAPFCAMGAEPGDLVTLLGCDPTLGSEQCQADEVCAVHASGARGICVPAGRESVVESCLAFLSSSRRYLAAETFADRLVLAERKRVLRTTPADGCSSATQCAALYDLEQALLSGGPLTAQSPASTDRFACERDPLVDPDRDVCVMTCAADTDCGDGGQCSGDGYCVEAELPPAECVEALQRYDVRAGNAFVVVGNVTGYLHDRMADPVTGACVADPAANPLAQSRVPLIVPPCTGDGFVDVAPNPCATTVTQFDKPAAAEGEPEPVGVERQAAAIRIRTPAFVAHLINPVLDPAEHGIACTLDGAPCPPMTFVPPGYTIAFTIGAGFAPLNAVSGMVYPIGMVNDPLGSIWFLDQGDDLVNRTRGQIVRFLPLELQVTGVPLL